MCIRDRCRNHLDRYEAVGRQYQLCHSEYSCAVECHRGMKTGRSCSVTPCVRWSLSYAAQSRNRFRVCGVSIRRESMKTYWVYILANSCLLYTSDAADDLTR